MSCNITNIVTTSGDSETQRSAEAGGSGLIAGSNVAGLLQSSVTHRERPGVASQAPGTLNFTSAEDFCNTEDIECGIGGDTPHRPYRIYPTPEDLFTNCVVQLCKQLIMLEEAVKNAPNTNMEVKAEIVILGETLKRLEDAAIPSRMVKKTSDKETQTMPTRGGREPVGDVKTVNQECQTDSDNPVDNEVPDNRSTSLVMEIQTPCWWRMDMKPVEETAVSKEINIVPPPSEGVKLNIDEDDIDKLRLAALMTIPSKVKGEEHEDFDDVDKLMCIRQAEIPLRSPRRFSPLREKNLSPRGYSPSMSRYHYRSPSPRRHRSYRDISPSRRQLSPLRKISISPLKIKSTSISPIIRRRSPNINKITDDDHLKKKRKVIPIAKRMESRPINPILETKKRKFEPDETIEQTRKKIILTKTNLVQISTQIKNKELQNEIVELEIKPISMHLKNIVKINPSQGFKAPENIIIKMNNDLETTNICRVVKVNTSPIKICNKKRPVQKEQKVFAHDDINELLTDKDEEDYKDEIESYARVKQLKNKIKKIPAYFRTTGVNNDKIAQKGLSSIIKRNNNVTYFDQIRIEGKKKPESFYPTRILQSAIRSVVGSRITNNVKREKHSETLEIHIKTKGDSDGQRAIGMNQDKTRSDTINLPEDDYDDEIVSCASVERLKDKIKKIPVVNNDKPAQHGLNKITNRNINVTDFNQKLKGHPSIDEDDVDKLSLTSLMTILPNIKVSTKFSELENESGSVKCEDSEAERDDKEESDDGDVLLLGEGDDDLDDLDKLMDIMEAEIIGDDVKLSKKEKKSLKPNNKIKKEESNGLKSQNNLIEKISETIDINQSKVIEESKPLKLDLPEEDIFFSECSSLLKLLCEEFEDENEKED